jgi:hypothetical protein
MAFTAGPDAAAPDLQAAEILAEAAAQRGVGRVIHHEGGGALVARLAHGARLGDECGFRLEHGRYLRWG